MLKHWVKEKRDRRLLTAQLLMKMKTMKQMESQVRRCCFSSFNFGCAPFNVYFFSLIGANDVLMITFMNGETFSI